MTYILSHEAQSLYNGCGSYQGVLQVECYTLTGKPIDIPACEICRRTLNWDGLEAVEKRSCTRFLFW
ncbi:MAG: hypothetical protein AABZ69_03385, partial [Candidatus Binatota bacterium]